MARKDIFGSKRFMWNPKIRLKGSKIVFLSNFFFYSFTPYLSRKEQKLQYYGPKMPFLAEKASKNDQKGQDCLLLQTYLF